MDKNHYIKILQEIQQLLQELIDDQQKNPEEHGNLRTLLRFQKLDAERIERYIRTGGGPGRNQDR